MIKANPLLVVKIAKNYEEIGVPLLDRISEGNIGLVRAVERFDPTKGANLSGYRARKQARTRFLTAVASALVLAFAAAAHAQLPPELVSQLNRSVSGIPGLDIVSFVSLGHLKRVASPLDFPLHYEIDAFAAHLLAPLRFCGVVVVARLVATFRILGGDINIGEVLPILTPSHAWFGRAACRLRGNIAVR